MTSQKITKPLVIIILLVSLLLPVIVRASFGEEQPPIIFSPNVSIPGSDFKVGEQIAADEAGKPALLVRYIQAVYKFFVGIAGIIAVFMIVFGGVMWLFSGGSSEKIGKAKDIIIGSVAGLLLAVGSYVILYNINPSLVQFQLNVQEVPGFTLPAFWCQDVETPAQIQDPKFIEIVTNQAVNLNETLCGKTYFVPNISKSPTGPTCHGAANCPGELICGNKYTDEKIVSECMSYEQACKNIDDGNAEDLGLNESQNSCDTVKVPPEVGACLWLDFSWYKLFYGDGCRYFSLSDLQDHCKVDNDFISSCAQYNYLPPIGFGFTGYAALPYREAFCSTDACAFAAGRANLGCSWYNDSCHD